jgi:tetratricopeptide (TPR) repeat protein
MKLSILPIIFLFLFIACTSNKQADVLDSLLKEPPYKGITDSIKENSKSDDLLIKRGNLLAGNKQFELAKQDFEKAWKINPTELTGILYGASLVELNQFENAITFFNAFAKNFPNNLKVKERLGFCYEQTGKLDNALLEYDAILLADPDDFITYNAKAFLLQQTNNNAEAIKNFEKSFAILPNVMAGKELASMYAESKNARALLICDALLKVDSSDATKLEPYYYKGRYYKNIGNTVQALLFFDKCIQLDYTFAYPYLDKGEILLQNKNYKEAINTLVLAKQVDNKNAEPYFTTAKCYIGLGEKSKAILELERAKALDKEYTNAVDELLKTLQ